MSNCHSAQAEYGDHDFMGGICKDCGEVSKRDVKALADQVAILESKVTELVERNRRLANQIVGYGDRMQQTIAGIVRDAKVEALREAGYEWFTEHETRSKFYGVHFTRDWLRARADNLEAS